MTTAELIGGILLRDVACVRREIEAYHHDADVWRLEPAIPNSAGTLAIHLAGNLRYYVGAVLGNTGYVRDREAEFSERDLPRAEILKRLDATRDDLTKVMPGLSDAQLAATYPVPVAGKAVSTADMLLHLAVHLTYHLGQMDYHRRLLGGSTKSLGAVSPADLRSARPAP